MTETKKPINFYYTDIDANGRFTFRSLQDDDNIFQNNIYHDVTGHDPNNYLTRIPLSKYFFGVNSPIFKNLNIGQILGKTLMTTSDIFRTLVFTSQ